MTSPGPQSVLIIKAPEAELVVQQHRETPWGQFNDVVPHLTIGHGHPLSDLRAAEKSVRAHLPIDGYAAAVTLMTQQSAGGY